MPITTNQIKLRAYQLLSDAYDRDQDLAVGAKPARLDQEAYDFMLNIGHIAAVGKNRYRITYAGRAAIEDAQQLDHQILPSS